MSPRTTPALPPESPLKPIVIAGGGVIGLSIALELTRRGVGVTVLPDDAFNHQEVFHEAHP